MYTLSSACLQFSFSHFSALSLSPPSLFLCKTYMLFICLYVSKYLAVFIYTLYMFLTVVCLKWGIWKCIYFFRHVFLCDFTGIDVCVSAYAWEELMYARIDWLYMCIYNPCVILINMYTCVNVRMNCVRKYACVLRERVSINSLYCMLLYLYVCVNLCVIVILPVMYLYLYESGCGEHACVCLSLYILFFSVIFHRNNNHPFFRLFWNKVSL